MTRVPGDTARSDQQDEQCHAAGAQHARLEACDEREPDHRERDRAPPPHRRNPQQGHDEKHTSDQDGDVGAGDRREMGQSRRPHGLSIAVGQQAGIAGDEPDQEAAGALALVPGGRSPDPIADVFAGCGEAARIPLRLP
jgi:hypothetical protein